MVFSNMMTAPTKMGQQSGPPAFLQEMGLGKHSPKATSGREQTRNTRKEVATGNLGRASGNMSSHQQRSDGQTNNTLYAGTMLDRKDGTFGSAFTNEMGATPNTFASERSAGDAFNSAYQTGNELKTSERGATTNGTSRGFGTGSYSNSLFNGPPNTYGASSEMTGAQQDRTKGRTTGNMGRNEQPNRNGFQTISTNAERNTVGTGGGTMYLNARSGNPDVYNEQFGTNGRYTTNGGDQYKTSHTFRGSVTDIATNNSFHTSAPYFGNNENTSPMGNSSAAPTRTMNRTNGSTQRDQLRTSPRAQDTHVGYQDRKKVPTANPSFQPNNITAGLNNPSMTFNQAYQQLEMRIVGMGLRAAAVQAVRIWGAYMDILENKSSSANLPSTGISFSAELREGESTIRHDIRDGGAVKGARGALVGGSKYRVQMNVDRSIFVPLAHPQRHDARGTHTGNIESGKDFMLHIRSDSGESLGAARIEVPLVVEQSTYCLPRNLVSDDSGRPVVLEFHILPSHMLTAFQDSPSIAELSSIGKLFIRFMRVTLPGERPLESQELLEHVQTHLAQPYNSMGNSQNSNFEHSMANSGFSGFQTGKQTKSKSQQSTNGFNIESPTKKMDESKMWGSWFNNSQLPPSTPPSRVVGMTTPQTQLNYRTNGTVQENPNAYATLRDTKPNQSNYLSNNVEAKNMNNDQTHLRAPPPSMVSSVEPYSVKGVDASLASQLHQAFASMQRTSEFMPESHQKTGNMTQGGGFNTASQGSNLNDSKSHGFTTYPKTHGQYETAGNRRSNNSFQSAGPVQYEQGSDVRTAEFGAGSSFNDAREQSTLGGRPNTHLNYVPQQSSQQNLQQGRAGGLQTSMQGLRGTQGTHDNSHGGTNHMLASQHDGGHRSLQGAYQNRETYQGRSGGNMTTAKSHSNSTHAGNMHGSSDLRNDNNFLSIDEGRHTNIRNNSVYQDLTGSRQNEHTMPRPVDAGSAVSSGIGSSFYATANRNNT